MGDPNDESRAEPSAGSTRPPKRAAPLPQKGGEAATTRVGMEEGDDTDTPATGLDPEKQSPEKRGGNAGKSTGGSLGAASGLQPSGTAPGGGPGTGVGSIGTGGGSTGNTPTGNARENSSE